MKKLLLFIALAICASTLFAQNSNNTNGIQLFHTPTQEEIEFSKTVIINAEVLPPPVGQIRPIAEWEPAEAVLIRYPLGFPLALVHELAKDIKVITVVSSSLQSTAYNQYSNFGVNMSNCEFLIAANNSYWTRDYGPWFMAIDNADVAMFDFYYNRPARPLDNQINTYLAPFLSSSGKPITRYASNMWLSGGNYMNDGIKQGFSSTLVLVENLQKVGLNEQQVRTQLNEYLGTSQFHFIQDPVSTASDYLQHIDCWSKLLAPDKVLVDSVAPSNTAYYSKFEAVANYFKSQTSSYGTPFKVYRAFAPGAPSSSPLTPYSNSLILNNKVFVPIGSNSYDAAAIAVYQQAMPGYTIIPVSNNLSYPDYWHNTDALHCRTHEIADRCMLYIKHEPLLAEIPNTGSVTFNAEFYSYCSNTIIADSVRVFLKHSGGGYEAYPMQNSGDNNWEITIAGLPSGLIEYYVIAADESGRRESHPYIARYAPNADPHKFTLTGELPQFPEIVVDKTESSVTSEGNEIIEDHITVSNIGSAELTFEISALDFDEMLTIATSNETVQPGESAIITLSYDFNSIAKVRGFQEYLGSFKVISNDPLNPEIEITLSAYYTPIEVPVLSLDKTNSSVTSEGFDVIEDHITVSNIGNAELTFEITALDFHEMLTIEPLDGTVQGGYEQIISLSYDFTNVENGEYLGSFKLISNDPLHLETEISLYAYQNYNGISDSKMSLLYIYPNPAGNELRVTSDELQEGVIEIFDVYGKKVLSHTAHHTPHTTINVSNLKSGVYFIKIENSVYKFVKQ
jgi:agmatine/peptidylarginine deiminase